MDNSFKSDAKASGILAVIFTVAAYIIGSIYFYFTGSNDSVSWVFILVFFIIVYAILLYAVRGYNDEYKAEKDLERRKAIQIQEKKEAQESVRLTRIAEYESLYGECTKVISNPGDSSQDFIRVYEKPSVIIIKDEKYSFDEIIGYNLTDNSRVIKGELSSSTSTSNASAVGRAVVGAALGGVAGAVIGGATAKQTTEYKQGEDKTIHDFSVNINVNRLSEPLVKLHIGRNEDLANEITALINAIVVRNNTTKSK